MGTVLRFRLPTLRAPRLRLRGPRGRRAWLRLTLVWVPIAYLAAIAAGWSVVETLAPDEIDPEYRQQLAHTRATAAESPDRPLGLVVGGSRTRLAFQRGLIPDRPAVNWVNLGRDGCGPVFARITLHRLLRDGIRPGVVVLEVMPPDFVEESAVLLGGKLTARDLALARRYWPAGGLERRFLAHRVLVPFLDSHDVSEAPLLVDAVAQAERESRTAAEQQTYTARARDLTISPGADRALHDAIAEAKAHDIRVVLLLAPEGPAFRSWYDPHALARFDAYIRAAAGAHQVTLIDAREWLGEAEFLDSHHVLKSGAAAFTTRLARDVDAQLGITN